MSGSTRAPVEVRLSIAIALHEGNEMEGIRKSGLQSAALPMARGS